MQNSLFTENESPESFELAPGTLIIYPMYEDAIADMHLDALINGLPWAQPSIRIHGRDVPIPRMQVWMGDANAHYTYSGQQFKPEPWHPLIERIKDDIELLTGHHYNSVLCNLYRDGSDSVGWHADDEPELDATTPIASLSLGATRRFDLKPKQVQRSDRVQIPLYSGKLLVMSPEVQQHWFHQIAKTKRINEPRINLTFRSVKNTSSV